MKVIVIRPEPGNSATVAAGRKLGLDMVGMPLFDLEPVAWELPRAECDGLLIGSANALRHGGPHLQELVNLPVHAVGDATADLARQFGFFVASTGSGGLQSVVDGLAGTGPVRLLRLAGEEHVPLTAPGNVEIETRIAYRVADRPVPKDQRGCFAKPACVMLHAAAAARHFAGECDRLGIDKSTISIAALGPRIAKAAGKDWASIGSASEPNDTALLAFVAKLCQKQDQ